MSRRFSWFIAVLLALGGCAQPSHFILDLLVSGSGTTSPSLGKHYFIPGTSVQVEAVPAGDWTFVGWGGDVVDTVNPLSVVMDANKTIDATFARSGATYTLSVEVDGDGSTDPAAGQQSHAAGTQVVVTAAPADGATFTGWTGAATGAFNPAVLIMDADKTLVAHFSDSDSGSDSGSGTDSGTDSGSDSGVSYTLAIGVIGGGSTSPAAGAHSYAAGTAVDVSATPSDGGTFTGWSGAASGTSNMVTVTMNEDKTLTATFTASRAPPRCDPPPAEAAYFASPTGTGIACTLAAPCSLTIAAGKPKAGETVYLRGGTYLSQGAIVSFKVANSGDPSRGWITFAAYPCELPIINAGGISITGTYVRFDGIATRNGESGFSNNLYALDHANGNLEFLNCIADMNTFAGIAVRSTAGVHIKQCIMAHNGGDPPYSWTSGVVLHGVQGTYRDNVIESTVSFENADLRHHAEGSGFLVDDSSTGATFVNDIGFRNGGSCIRLSASKNTHVINNTCYHDGLDPKAGTDSRYPEPKSPGEILFFDSAAWSGAVLLNNLAAAAGWNGVQSAFNNNGAIAISPFNIGVDQDGATPFFTAPDGINPDFHIASGSPSVIGAGSATEAPTRDIGFDPKCITKAVPTGAGVQSWWIYSVDYTYISSIGGIAQCFNPKARSGDLEIGAYAY